MTISSDMYWGYLRTMGRMKGSWVKMDGLRAQWEGKLNRPNAEKWMVCENGGPRGLKWTVLKWDNHKHGTRNSVDFGTALGNFDLNMNAVIHRNTVMPWWNLDNLVWSLGPIVTIIGRSANPDSLCEACQNRTVWLGSLVIWLRSNREPWTGEIIIHQINVDTQQLINLFSQLGIDFFFVYRR